MSRTEDIRLKIRPLNILNSITALKAELTSLVSVDIIQVDNFVIRS